MGGGVYSNSDRMHRSALMGYTTKSCNEIFTQHNINNAMNPFGVTIRESRDSIEHPNSVPIILALDITGSMGSIPHHMVKEGLPKIMGTIIQNGIPDPQLLFLGIGDHECDQSPLQVGQFESSDELLDKWLTTIWLEGGGGGNDGESYLLAWYFAAYHTITDNFEKRNKKGFLFTIGDEPVLSNITDRYLTKIMGGSQYNSNYTSVELLDKAREKYNVYHLHIKETSSGSRIKVIDGWKQLMKDNLIVVDRYQDVSKIISEIIISNIIVNTEPQSPRVTKTEIIL
jgi:hypothetical protein